LHSSANNHLLGEYMGLLVGCTGWPLWPRSAEWRRIAVQGFEAEALRQNAPDGVNREQATYYHHEVADMMILCGLIGKANGVEFSASYWERLEAMLRFISAIMDRSGHVPMIGDADDAHMVRLAPGRADDPYRPLLAFGAVTFANALMARQAGQFDDKTRWLLGDAADARFATLCSDPRSDTESAHRPRTFPHGGYFLLGDRLGQPEEVLMVVDAAPLGYLSIAAHGHADALAVTLNVDGEEVLIDPGTFAYHTQRKWRDYFKGTSAHNTVRIDGVDQSVSGGNFLWLHHARARCELFESDEHRDRFIGVHDGYQRLADPVTHRREIVFDKGSRVIDVTDTLECNSVHDVELFWHLAEHCHAVIEVDAVHVRTHRASVRISLRSAGFAVELVTGREEPPLGWISRTFDRKQPICTIRWHGRMSGNTTLHTRIQIGAPPS
jgi:hypothetical protein